MHMKYLANITRTFLTGSHFAQILKVALLSISLNLEA